MNRKGIYAIVLLLSLFGAIFAYASTQLEIPTSGVVTTPALLTSSESSFNWGDCYPNDVVVNRTILTNIGTEPTSPLSVTASPTVGTLTNNITNVVLAGGQSVTAEFTLTIDASPTVGSFSFGITIVG